jgi:hypothetical protein
MTVALPKPLWQLAASSDQKAPAMRSSFLFSVAAFTVATLAAPAIAQDAASDVRCVLVANAFAATEKEVDKKQFATQTAHFFYGRVDARLTPPQLKAQVIAVSKTLTPQNLAPTMNACVTRLKDRLGVMQQIGREMAAMGAKPQPKK